MTLANRSLKNENWWQTYKQLELIPDSVANPYANLPALSFGLNLAWRTLLSLLLAELIDEQQVEYLERCLSLDEFGQGKKSPALPIQRLWLLM